MTLRTAALLGVIGSAMPFAGIASWAVAATVAGQPLANQPFNAGAGQFALANLLPAAVLGFLVTLYLVTTGHIQPSRLGDASLAASALVMVGLAGSLRWALIPRLFSGLGHGGVSWLTETHWRTAHVLVPVAWLAFLVSFVRWPGPPPAHASCRAAGWLGLVTAAAGVWPVLDFANALVYFYVGFASQGLSAFSAWMNLIGTFIAALHWVLLCSFALAVWHIKPAAE